MAFKLFASMPSLLQGHFRPSDRVHLYGGIRDQKNSDQDRSPWSL